MNWTLHRPAVLLAVACLSALYAEAADAAHYRSHRKASHSWRASRKSHRISKSAHPLNSSFKPAPVVPNADANAQTIDRAWHSRDPFQPPTGMPTTKGENIARTALAYRGVPYRFGGRSAQSGFDCSGLVQAVCAKWGIYLPRVAGAQFARGVAVKPDEMKAGDLVFFKGTYKHGLSHVGIFIGAGQFVHAAGRGKGVRISELDERYFKAHWAGARRLDLSQLPHTGDETPISASDVTVDPPTQFAEPKARAGVSENQLAPKPQGPAVRLQPPFNPPDERKAGEAQGEPESRGSAPRLRK